MKITTLFLVLLFSFLAKAQTQDGKSQINFFSISQVDIAEMSEPEFWEHNQEKIDAAKKNETFSFTSKVQYIGHIKPEPFFAFSCRWEEKKITDVKVTFRFFNDTKSETIQIEKDSHFEGDANKRVSKLYYLDKAYTNYEVIVEAKKLSSNFILSELIVNLFNPYSNKETMFGAIPKSVGKACGTSRAFGLKMQQLITNQTNEVNQTEQTQACPCNLPTYITHPQWNCPQGAGLVTGVGTSSNVTHLIVHHSAGNNTATDWNAVVQSVWNYHTGTNGWSDIGYNWLIAPNGQLYEGRGSNSLSQNVTGAHFCGTNANTMGVCMLGTYTSVDITAEARATLVKVLAWKCCQQNIPPIGTAFHASSGLTLNRISGHRDGCSTE